MSIHDSTVSATVERFRNMPRDEFDAIRDKVIEISKVVRGNDIVFCPAYEGSTTGLLRITTNLHLALDVANEQQGFPVYLYVNGKRTMKNFYNGGTKTFFNGMSYFEYTEYCTYRRSCHII